MVKIILSDSIHNLKVKSQIIRFDILNQNLILYNFWLDSDLQNLN